MSSAAIAATPSEPPTCRLAISTPVPSAYRSGATAAALMVDSEGSTTPMLIPVISDEGSQTARKRLGPSTAVNM